MSSAAHQFGPVEFEYWIFVVLSGLQAGAVEKNQNKYSKFKILHVQIDELPRTSNYHRLYHRNILVQFKIHAFTNFCLQSILIMTVS